MNSGILFSNKNEWTTDISNNIHDLTIIMLMASQTKNKSHVALANVGWHFTFGKIQIKG